MPTGNYRLKGFRPRYKVRFDKRGRYNVKDKSNRVDWQYFC